LGLLEALLLGDRLRRRGAALLRLALAREEQVVVFQQRCRRRFDPTLVRVVLPFLGAVLGGLHQPRPVVGRRLLGRRGRFFRGGPGGGAAAARPAARRPALGRRRLGRRLAFRLCGQGGFRLGGRPGRLVGRGRRHRGRREQVLALREGQVVKVLDVGDVRALP